MVGGEIASLDGGGGRERGREGEKRVQGCPREKLGDWNEMRKDGR